MEIKDLTIIRPLGHGGFGETTLVENKGKRCVLKRILPQAISKHGNLANDLFCKEITTLRQLGSHPQIPDLIDSGTDEKGMWLIQDYIPGANLEQTLDQNGAFSEHQIIRLLQSLLPVLRFMHYHGIIHRDIKPANIINRENTYILVDFGAAKLISETILKKTGTMIGSAMYAAPEQTYGKSTYSSDIYSLGVTCIHLFTGMPPFDLIDMSTGQFAWKDYRSPCSEQLAIILDRMLARGTLERYQSADAVLLALEELDLQIRQARRAREEKRLQHENQTKSWAEATIAAVSLLFILCSVNLWSGGHLGIFHLCLAICVAVLLMTKRMTIW
jgi:Ca-activated chloride channel homolog